ncbi:MAG: fumarylacetoacetate hydrolase family protein [Thermoguttaceae bacterium]|jgi:2-keto-4-pentenoate hydratase/2-oxohepta-3-ene-1,7-dioic acid hydratase in catechol pathway
MRLVSFRADGAGRIGILRGDRVFDLGKTDPGLPRCMKTLLEMGAEGLRRAAIAAEGAIEAIPSHQVDLLPPVPQPEKIICVGLNYADHAAETGIRPPREPVIFNKLPTTLRASGDPIVLPELSREVDYEAELVVVIGAGGRAIPRDKALAHVAGYTCGNDVSARDWQKGKPGGQWLLGKSFDSFAPTGPALVTADEVGDAGKLRIKCRLNGRLVQDSCTDQLIFPVAELIAYVSSVATLKPGDLIFTGTPPGVGMARTPPLYLRAGDLVEVEIERVGLLRNRVAGPPPASSE